MAATMAVSRPYARKLLAGLGKATAGALVGIALTFIYLQAAIIGMVIPPLAVFTGISLLLAAIVATGWRWAPLLGVLWGIFMIVGNMENITYEFTHPQSSSFPVVVALVAVASVAIIAGLGATVQNYRAMERRTTPRWFPYLVATIAGLAVGAILLASAPQDSASTGVSPEVLAELDPVTVEGFGFQQKEIRVRAGDTVALRLENPSQEAHSFDVDEFNVHAFMPAGENGLA
ncbi:MAG: hypothetical protein ACRDIB_10775, partial [Ardenticatenaceae bacterium]